MRFECRRLSFAYASRGGPVVAVDDVSFAVGEREFVCIVGPSGCGKTTLLRLVAGLLPPSSGELAFERTAGDGRLRAALVFQEDGLFPWMSVLDNVAFGLKHQAGRARARERAAVFLAQVGLGGVHHRYPHELSAGMRQRASLARAFLADADLLLMDEPLGALDALTKLVLRQELVRIWREEQKVVLYVTHDIEEALVLGDRVLVMAAGGRIRADLPVRLARPREGSAAAQPEIQRLRGQIWALLEAEVKRSVCLPA